MVSESELFMEKVFKYITADHFLRNILQRDKRHSSRNNVDVNDICDILDFFPERGMKLFDRKESCSAWSRCNVLGQVPFPCKDGVTSGRPVVYFLDYPGLFYLPGYLKREDQLCLANECLRIYLNPPNLSNLFTSHGSYRSTSNFSETLHDIHNETEDRRVPAQGYYWPEQDMDKEKNHPFNKLRWVTLGKHYKWSDRSYDTLENIQELPEIFRFLSTTVVTDVAKLCKACGVIGPLTPASSGTPRWSEKTASEQSHYDEDYKVFSPNAALINIYKSNDRLGGHQDDAEGTDSETLTPLVSISLGSPCLFLMGSSWITTIKPLCLVLYSGDFLILSNLSRLLVHGVPTILAAPKCNSVTQSGLCRKERRKRLNDAKKLQTKEFWSAAYETPIACCMDDFLERLDNVKTKSVHYFQRFPECRVLERSNEQRCLLVDTLQHYRINISIREMALVPK